MESEIDLDGRYFLATTLILPRSTGALSPPARKQIFDRSGQDVNRLFVLKWDKYERAA